MRPANIGEHQMKTQLISVLRECLMAIALLGGSADLLAQANWPTRPIRFLVGNSPGSAPDIDLAPDFRSS